MHQSDLLARGTLSRALTETLSHLTWHDAPVLAGESILRTSYWFKSGSVVRDAFFAGALNAQEEALVRKSVKDSAQPFSANQAEWQGVAKDLGFPDALPRSVTAILNVEKNRRDLLAMTLWDEKMAQSTGVILAQHAISRPGAYSPCLLSGPTGASKTHSVRAAYAALGIGVHVVEGSPAITSDVRIEKITGGDKGRAKDFQSYVKDLAGYGYFQTQEARLQYYRDLVKASKDNKGVDLVDAHDRIPREAWSKLAERDGYPIGETSFSVNYPGMIRLGLTSDQVVLLDEVNKFSSPNQQEIRNFISCEGSTFGVNGAFAFTANPPSAEYPNRSVVGADLMGCCYQLNVDPRSAAQYGEFIRGQLGIGEEQAGFSDEVTNLVRDNNPRSPDRSTPTDMSMFQSSDHVPIFAQILTRDVIGKFSERVGQLQETFEREASPGGKLHPTTFGVERDASKPSVRSLCAFLKRINDRVASELLVTGRMNEDDRQLSGGELSQIVSTALTERFQRPYMIEIDGAAQILQANDVQNVANGNDPNGNSAFIAATLRQTDLNPDGIAKLFASPAESLPQDKLDFARRNFGLTIPLLNKLKPEELDAVIGIADVATSNATIWKSDGGKVSVLTATLTPVGTGWSAAAGTDLSQAELKKVIENSPRALFASDLTKDTAVLANINGGANAASRAILCATFTKSSGKFEVNLMGFDEYNSSNNTTLQRTGKPFIFGKTGPITKAIDIFALSNASLRALDQNDDSSFLVALTTVAGAMDRLKVVKGSFKPEAKIMGVPSSLLPQHPRGGPVVTAEALRDPGDRGLDETTGQRTFI